MMTESSKTMDSKSWQKVDGFTLVELLVVIAIMSLLMALLAPALRNARDQAKSIVCMSNLKQLGLAMTCYTNDFDGSFVPYYDSVISIPWPQILSQRQHLFPVDSGIQACPSLRGSASAASGAWVHYAYNHLHIGSSFRYDGSFTPARFSDIAQPLATILLLDAYRPDVPSGYYIVIDAVSGPSLPHARHNGGLNICWVDGHVSYMKIQNPLNPWVELGELTNPTSLWDRN